MEQSERTDLGQFRPGGSLCMSVLPHVRYNFCGLGGDFLPQKAGPRGNK
jgi:hypothetical protein